MTNITVILGGIKKMENNVIELDSELELDECTLVGMRESKGA